MSAGQYDEMRVQLASNKQLRQAVTTECVREVAKESPAFRRLVSAMLDMPAERAGKAFCERMIAAIANGKVSYNDYNYALTALK